MAKTNDRKEVILGRRLLDTVFSWSITDVLNENLYENQVKKIPEAFPSTSIYMRSFILPLLEETHADLLSSIRTLCQAPIGQITRLRRAKKFQFPSDFLYHFFVLKERGARAYMPAVGDLIAVTNVRPKCIDDLNRPESPYVIAFVHRTNPYTDELTVLSSKLITAEGMDHKMNDTVYAVYLTNMTTNIRIWRSLNGELEGRNMKIIDEVLQVHSSDSETCAECLAKANCNDVNSEIRAKIFYSDLNDSQRDAVLSCISLRECYHQNTVKLIWGPPGTGKTTTVGMMLSSLLKLKCRTLTCAPTNVAVLEVAKRLLKEVKNKESPRYGCYGLGDIVLFGNGERMKIDDHKDLHDVFLDYRVDALKKCLGGWKSSLASMISLLKHPEKQYLQYLKDTVTETEERKDCKEEKSLGDKEIERNQEKEKINGQKFKDKKRQKIRKINVTQVLKESIKGKNQNGKKLSRFNKGDVDSQSQNNKNEEETTQVLKESTKGKKQRGKKLSGFNKGDVDSQSQNNKNEEETTQDLKESTKGKKQKGKKLSRFNTGDVDSQSQNNKNEEETTKIFKPWTFEEFVNKRFNSIYQQLTSCILNLYTHLPTTFISQKDVMNMFIAHDHLHSLTTLFNSFSTENTGLKQILYDSKGKDSGVGCYSKLRMAIKKCLHILKLLPKGFSVKGDLREFCLANACMVFCTVSSTVKLHREKMSPLEILVIDEAAQLKECESTIPLQLSGIRHTILIGDERQLPAMVQSKISENAEFGRSLFERLVELGRKKHLLDVQHRMHPSISLFPNKEFYKSEILDGQNVKEKNYERNFLPGKMYGSYSFINVAHGKEEFDDNCSQRNMVEAHIVSEIVKNLHEEYVRTNIKVRVGVISPYKAQVYAIEDKVKRYARVSDSGGFEVKVRSVDGFQGGEEDVIIMSTVRSNGKGSIGFLADQRRVNVALTRARHCIWILGNGITLVNSKSVWKKLVIDAKKRGCFYNAEEDKCLARALLYSLIELNEVDTLQNVHPSLFSHARWKVRFSDEFWYSMGRVGSRDTFNQVLSMLEKLSNGWRKNHKRKFVRDGVSSQLLQQYNVNGWLSLVWSVDILHENLQCIQVMMVWDILPYSDIHKIAKRIDIFYSNYTTDEIDHCKYKCVQGNLVIPMRWPVNSSNCSEVQAVQLSRSFASLRIADV